MKTTVAKEWDQKAKTYSKMASSKKDDSYEYFVNFPSILDLCPQKADRVLDLGSGSGDFTEILSQKYNRVDGSDVSPNMVSIAKERFNNLNFFTLDLEEPFNGIDNGVYDLIVCKLVLMFINNITNVANETYRILKPNGALVISVHHPLYWINKYLENKLGFSKRPEFDILENGYFSEVAITKSIGGNKELVFDFINRKLETYINSFTKSGFILDKISEPQSNEKEDFPSRLNIRFIKN